MNEIESSSAAGPSAIFESPVSPAMRDSLPVRGMLLSRPTLPCTMLPATHSIEMSDCLPLGDAGWALRSELAELELLSDLPPELLDELVLHCPVVDLERGGVLLRAGEPNAHMFVVLSGELHVQLDALMQVASLAEGATVGELSVLDHKPVSATVVAFSEARLLAISEVVFWRLCRISHGFAMRLMLKLAERLRANNGTVIANIERRRRLERDVAVDALTGVSSRRWLDESLPALLSFHRVDEHPMSVCVVDVDYFKRINDTFGHQQGDVVLQTIAQTLRGELRPTDYVARFGGEEFVVVLPHTGQAGARKVAERLVAAVRKLEIAMSDGDTMPMVTISVGCAQLAEGDECLELLARADEAMYRAKRGGRDRVEG